MAEVTDKVLDWYSAKSLAESLRDAGGVDDLYRAETYERQADSLLREITFSDPDELIPTCLAVCEARGWSLHWTARGAYLHLEASELIEAWRGKGKSTVAQEAGDVLLVLFSILGASKTSWVDALACARAKMEDLQTRPRYPGEEYSETVPALAMREDGE